MEANKCPQIPYFGAQYPDACCIDGQLYDLDKCDDEGNLYEPGEFIPCPFCQTEDYYLHVKGNTDTTGNVIDREWVEEWVSSMRKKYK